ncbi:9883_t:CDS:2, partial [Dentiscutata heterogama]
MIPNSLKIAQSKPVFKVYQKKNKNNSYHPYKQLTPITSAINLCANSLSTSNNFCDSCVTSIKSSSSIIKSLSLIIKPLFSIDEPLSPINEPLSPITKTLPPTIKPLSPIIASSSKDKSSVIDLVSDIEDDINIKKLWPNSTKKPFLAKAALYLGKGKTATQ